MTATLHSPSGREYLRLATNLLQTAHRGNATGGVWEAADLQWWWRLDRHRDPRGQTFWVDGGSPVAAVVLTRFGPRWQLDLLSEDHDLAPHVGEMWPRAIERLEALGAERVELTLRPEDRSAIEAAEASGFLDVGHEFTISWTDSSRVREAPALPAGFVLTDRVEAKDRPHPFVRRNGEHIASRLAECSLYRPTFDLAISAPDGRVAAYGCFWPDAATGVGLVEPMRTEDEFQGLGLARHLLSEGLRRLARSGCSRLKVTFDPSNEPARRLYLGAGFEPSAATRTYVRDRGAPARR